MDKRFVLFRKTFIFVVVFCLLFVLYYSVTYFVPNNDQIPHVYLSIGMFNGSVQWAGNFLLYLLVALLSGFSQNLGKGIIALCAVLAFATTLKFAWTQKQIAKIELFGIKNKKEFWMVVLIALSLLFVYAIPIPYYYLNNYFYIGAFVPNMWHNSTSVLLFPFAIVLFYQSFEQIKEYKASRNINLLLLLLLNLSIKPSFVFVFVVIYPIFLLQRYKLTKEFFYSLAPVVVAGLCLVVEYYIIYRYQSPSLGEAQKQSSIVIQPFAVFQHRVSLRYMPISLFFSLLFPILYAAFNYKKLFKDRLFWYIISSLFVSLGIYFLLAESGPRFSDGNLSWQIVFSVWICYFQSLVFLLGDIKRGGWLKRNIFLVSVYCLHVLMGIWWLFEMFRVGTFF